MNQTKNTSPQSDFWKKHLSQKSNKCTSVFGFTLTELIVTISILAILGAISIMSIQNFYGSARDSVRVSDIQSIHQWLSLYKAKADFFPIPENPIEIQAGTETLSYQGYIGENLSRVININKTPTDPIDLTRYIYTVDKTKKKAQLMGYLESGDTLKVTAYDDLLQNFINESYATTNTIDYTSRFVYVTGDKIGVLTNENNAPIQESATGTGIDLNTTDTTGYVAYFWWDTYGAGESTGTGDILITQIQWAITDTIPCSNPITYSGYSITALSHNENKTFTKPITIANGTGTGYLQVACINGTVDIDHAIETIDISCNTNFVNQSNSCIPDVCGDTPPLKSHSTATSQTITQNWTQNPIPGICTFDCDTNYTYNLGTNTCNANTQTALACNGSTKPSSHDNSTATTWTQTWNGTEWLPVYTYTRNPTPNICTYDCDTGHSWDNTDQICTLNSYTVSWWFGVNANGATISVCGSNVTADASGNFTTSRSYGSVCNNIIATRANYTCATTTNGPASLASNFTMVAGSCTAIVNGACGTSNNTATVTAPSTNLCSAGNATIVTTNPGTFTWSCNGINTGTNTSCTAPRQYSVTFDGNLWSGHAPASKSVTYNTAVGTLTTTNPTRTGYTFNGWFTATTGGTQITTATVVTANVTWYAQWTLNSYTVSGSFGVNANGATISVCGSNVTADASGNFTTSRSYGSVCNNITATRANYTCATTTNGPASLIGNFTSVAGSCTAIVNGTCGTSNNLLASTSPSTGLCSLWTPTIVADTGIWWTWSCNGSNGGTSVSCQAPQSYPNCTTTNIQLTNNQVWAACNIGSSVAGLTATSYGSYYQWGNNSTIWTAWWTTDNWGLWWQWPCAMGYHVPTQPQWQIAYDNQGANLPISLKLPMAGALNNLDGSLSSQGSGGFYWWSSPYTAATAYSLRLTSTSVFPAVTGGSRASGFSVRCLKN